MVETTHGEQLEAIQCDIESEYTSNQIKRYLGSHGIQQMATTFKNSY